MHHLLFAALSTFSSKQFERSCLEPGDYPVQLKVSGTVAGEKVGEKIAGTLSIGSPQPRSSKSAPKTVTILAAVLYRVSPAKRRQILADLKASKELQADDACDAAAAELLGHFTTLTSSTVNGSLSFGEG